MNALETFGLGVRYSQSWAVRDCTLSIEEGHVVALVGSNGAGKTTLLHCAVGLTEATCGTISVLGDLRAGSDEALARVAFVAQDTPLYRHLTVTEMVEVAANLNRSFDLPFATARLRQLDIPAKRRVGKLSGGQQAQLALTLALARHPDLVILDEPLARLDPVARHDVMALVLSMAAEEGISVIFSSHVVSELERVADYLVLMAHGSLQLTGPIDEILASHTVLAGPADDADRVATQCSVVHVEQAARRVQLLVRHDQSVDIPPGWEASPPSLDELVLAYLRDPSVVGRSGPLALAATRAGGTLR